MSLFKQISLIMSLFLFFILITVMSFNFTSASKHAQEELSSSTQNAASYLSLSLANAKGDTSTMATMINAVFDSGSFQNIILLDTDEKVVFERLKVEDNSKTPQWFRNLYEFKTPMAKATVSSGWTPIGYIEVIPMQENTHVRLYNNFLDLVKASTFIAVLTFILLYVLLKIILASTKKLQAQAEAISNNEFIINENIPTTTEFKEVSLAMNKMVLKVKHIFEREAESVKNYHQLLYTDKLTNLGNRNLFELKLNEYIKSEDADANGVILTLYFDGIEKANNFLGHEKVDNLILELSAVMKESLHIDGVISRLDGSKLAIIIPRTEQDELEELSHTILSKSIIILEKSSLYDCAIKVLNISYDTKDSVNELLVKIDKLVFKAEKNIITYDDPYEIDDINLEKSLIQDRIQEHSIAIALRNIHDKKGNILHSEAFVRLFDEDTNMHEAGKFIPLVPLLNLDIELDKNVINCAINEPNLLDRRVALNISSRFMKDKDSAIWLKERLASLSDKNSLIFEVSNTAVLSALNSAHEFFNILKSLGFEFGIDRFNIESTNNLNYLQMLQPSYLKIDSAYLLDMLKGSNGQNNNALQILIESLDIKIIATNIENQETKDKLTDLGIYFFQGSFISSTKLI